MPELLEFRGNDLPDDIRLQVLSFLRIEWPGGFSGPNQYRDWISKPDEHPVHFVVVESGLLISHAEVLWKHLDHGGESFKTSGLSGVLTYPGFRRQGFGHQVVEAGSKWILQSDADIAMLWCNPALENFYGAFGWIGLRKAITLMGPKDDLRENEELLMMLFLSARGKAKQASFEAMPIYFGLDTW